MAFPPGLKSFCQQNEYKFQSSIVLIDVGVNYWGIDCKYLYLICVTR